MPIATPAPSRRAHALRRRSGGKRTRRLRRTVLTALAALGLSATLAPPALAAPVGVPVSPGGQVIGWGNNSDQRTEAPELPAGQFYTAVAAAEPHSLGLTSTGQVISWGDTGSLGEVPRPPAGQTYTEIAASFNRALALTSGGQAIAWGSDSYGVNEAPVPTAGQTYTAIAAGNNHSMALTSVGQVTAWGVDSNGLNEAPDPPAGQTFTAIAAGRSHSLALTSDGQVIAWGDNSASQTEVPDPPAGQTYAAISASGTHSMALTSGGQVVSWGRYLGIQMKAPTLPDGESYTAIAAGYFHALALTSAGRVIAWGTDTAGQATVPELAAGQTYMAIAAGGYHSLAVATIPLQAPGITGTPPAALVGQQYSHAFTVSGHPVPTVTVTAGDLPAGLTLSEAGVLSGTPTAAGTSSFTVTVTNSVDTSSLEVELVVAAAPAAPTFVDTTPVALNGVVGSGLTRQFEVTGNPAPVITVSDPEALPPGMTVVDGVLAGTPSAAGTYAFTLIAANGVDPDAELDVTVTVTAAPSVPGAPDTSLFGSLAPLLGFGS